MLSVGETNIDCVDSGEGPALLFLPGSYSTPAAWRPIQRLLPPGLRTVTTSLCGYGGTTETRTMQDLDMRHEVRLVEQLARHVGQPLHLVGHSFGATVALAAALSGSVEVASLSLFEANPIELTRHRTQGALHEETLAMSRAFEAAAAADEVDAPGRIIDFWGNDGAYAAMPDPVKTYCRQTVHANVLDWRTAFAFEMRESDYALLDIPVLLVRGGQANAAMVQITEALGDSLPRATPRVVDGAGHFLITSHGAQCAQLLSDFLARVV